MGCGIYKIKNLVTDKIYIGSSVCVKTRLIRHKSMLRGNYYDNQHLQNSYNKHGEDSFIFEQIEECEKYLLVDRENFNIMILDSNNPENGFNLALVNEFRRNNFNYNSRVKMSKTKLKNNNNNIGNFKLISIESNNEYHFDNLIDAAEYLINNGYSKSTNRMVREKLSKALRGIKLHNGKNNNGSIRKTIYKHRWKLLN